MASANNTLVTQRNDALNNIANQLDDLVDTSNEINKMLGEQDAPLAEAEIKSIENKEEVDKAAEDVNKANELAPKCIIL